MEKREERVLAYQVATVMKDDELAHVSGGGSGLPTTRRTVKVSGVQGWDIDYDVTLDW